MTTLEFDYKKYTVTEIEEFCVKRIGPRKFYLHTKFGGEGWNISRPKTNRIIVEVQNEQIATLLALKFS